MKKLLLIVASIMFATQIYAQKGYEKSIELGYQREIGDSYSPTNGFNVSMVNGYRFNKVVSLGVGVGVDYTFWKELTSTLSEWDCYSVQIPLFVRGKFNLIEGKYSPYFVADLGYSIMIGSESDEVFAGFGEEKAYHRSGFMFAPGFGLDINLDEKKAVYFQLAYNLHANHETDFIESNNINAVDVKVGFKF